MGTRNLYDILGVKANATDDEIKSKFRKLALKLHPDKNTAPDASERFNELYLAYEILSNRERRHKYDELNTNDMNNFNELIKNMLKTLLSSSIVDDIFNAITKTEFSDNYDSYKNEIQTRRENKYNLEYVNNLFKNHLKTNDYQANTSIFESNCEVQRREYSLLNSGSATSEETDICLQSDIHIRGKIKTTLEEMYNNPIKTLDVTRIVIENNDTVAKKFRYNIDITNDALTLKKQGDDYITEDGEIATGDLILEVECAKHKYYERVSNFDILITLPMTLYEMFTGFKKSFMYLDGKDVEIEMNKSFSKLVSNNKIIKQTRFDGEKIFVTIENLGLKADDNGRGNLIVCLLLVKTGEFNGQLKKYFN